MATPSVLKTPTNILAFPGVFRREQDGPVSPVLVFKRRREITSRTMLMAELDRVGAAAPHAPLSFLLVRVQGLAGLSAAEQQLALDAVGRHLLLLSRPTDCVGRFSGASFGVVLQGTGATAAAAVAARLGWNLKQLVAGFRVPLQTVIYAATGTGLNADMLPVAALETCEDCG